MKEFIKIWFKVFIFGSGGLAGVVLLIFIILDLPPILIISLFCIVTGITYYIWRKKK